MPPKKAKAKQKTAEELGPTLYNACYDGDLAEVKELIETKGVNVNFKTYDDLRPLYTAALRNHNEVVKYLLTKGANIDEKNGQIGASAVYIASDKGYLDIVKTLADAGANVNLKINGGFTPLYIATQNNHNEVVKYLLAKGANVDEKNGPQGSSALSLASDKGYFDIVKILVDAGANVNLKINTNFSPLYTAAQNNHNEVVKYLLAKGANVDEKNGPGWTALHIACHKGFLDIVKILADAGADTKLTNNHGETPLDIARVKNNHAVVAYLESLIPEENKPKWKGFTRSDISKFDTIFGDDAINIAVCPICLKYVERSDACMYMTHNCSTLGGFYHPDLYSKYKNAAGQISWCTICGRVCVGHNHYELGLAKDAKSAVIATAHDPFSKDCRDANGGGGLPEKFSRFRRMREVALALQDNVGTMTEENALKELIEETWNAPLFRAYQVPKIMTTRAWNIPSNAFPPNAPQALNAPAANYNNPAAYEVPIVRTPGTNTYQGNMITLDDTEPVIQFKHKKADGTLNDAHGQITVSSLIHYLDNAGGTKGKCFDDACGGVLWPKEIEIALANPAFTVTDEQKARVAAYKARFNSWHAEGAVGGKHRRTQRRRRVA